MGFVCVVKKRKKKIMSIINFPVTCAICKIKTTKRMDWLVFHERTKEYIDSYLCPACSDKEEKRICTVSRGTMGDEK